ncbi:zinc ribbon domain-containing protein [uncultured Mitsuokella sp.]|uniref:zinc ribbon domain-containing protein n=1 Tax=uncultured Mitsuokella sp. TaxID=453120 RepID=UPI0025DCAABF|nr:zinc ribbon domain-containing protein [uncultured Mitsuokella sp.]
MSAFAAIKDGKAHPEKYKGRPKLPAYKRKNGFSLLILTNQHFVQIPFARFIQMLQYKAESAGIQVILTEESYTSDTSFLDNECLTKEFYNKNRRVHRGLFRANDSRTINADVNGAFQIMKKVGVSRVLCKSIQ